MINTRETKKLVLETNPFPYSDKDYTDYLSEYSLIAILLAQTKLEDAQQIQEFEKTVKIGEQYRLTIERINDERLNLESSAKQDSFS